MDRFLYGLDDDIQRRITLFAKATVPAISEQTIGQLDMAEEDRAMLMDKAVEAQDAFISGL